MYIDFHNVDAKYEAYLDYMRELAYHEEQAAYQEYLHELSVAEEEESEVTPVLELCKQFLAVKSEDFQDTPLRGIEGRYLVLKDDDVDLNKIYIAENHIRIYLGDFKAGGFRLKDEPLQEFLGRIKADFVAEWTNHITNTIEDLQNEVYYYQDLRIGMHQLLGIENPKDGDIPF